MAAPSAPRGPLVLLCGLRLRLSLTLALALLIGLSAASSSSASPSVAAAGSTCASRCVAAVPGPAASRTPGGLQRSVLALPASPVARHVIALAVAPAGRRLLAYPVESPEAHEAGDPAAAAAPAAAETISDAEVRDITVEDTTFPDYGWGSLSDSPLHPDAAAALLYPTSATVLAPPASPIHRHVLSLPAEATGPHAADGPAAAPAPAASPAGDEAGREVPVPPRATPCSFVTYIGGAAETVQRGDGRVLEVREFTAATNGNAATAGPDATGYGRESPSNSDSDSDSDEDAHDPSEDNFSVNMAEFCAYVAYVSDIFDVIKPLI